MKKLLIELIQGLKWVILIFVFLAVSLYAWIGCAWCIGWGLNHYKINPQNFKAVGSCAMAFVLVIQVVVLILIGWVLNAYRRSHGIVLTRTKNAPIR
jgi:heme/copper-type cytochrome/quinol oxidase subunit 2